MRCVICGYEPMVPGVEDIPYSSLPGVVLRNMTVHHCPGCGEKISVIPRILDLQRALVRRITSLPHRLTGAQLRFLRKAMGWSGVEQAERLGVTAETVSRWENGHAPMGEGYERLLRLLALVTSPQVSAEDVHRYVGALPTLNGTEPRDMDLLLSADQWLPPGPDDALTPDLAPTAPPPRSEAATSAPPPAAAR